MPSNITRQNRSLSETQRRKLLGQSGLLFWLTGLSGSGKSTIAHALERRLTEMGMIAYVLDGDNVRHGLTSDLGFSDEDRSENVRRIAEVSALFCDAAVITITAFISPFRADRAFARAKIPNGHFVEVFVDTPIEICEQRDPKGLYQKARAGSIPDFTGISSPYEAPENPEIHLKAGEISADECVDEIVSYLQNSF